jgi:nifR3 family TIM-barrel protein
MPQGFWSQLRRPFLTLAPMSGVTDAPYRRIIAKYGKPDVMWTGFLPADGLASAGRRTLIHDLGKSEAEHPIVAQIVGCKPGEIRAAAQLIAELGFDGVDINMGCPVRDVERRHAGAALMRLPELAQELILAAKEGAGGLPVSVKTRIGYRRDEIDEWLGNLLAVRPAAITIHARARDEAYDRAARWGVVARAVELARVAQADETARTLIIGNGDVQSTGEARQRALESGCDGVMIGRRVRGNPWLFNEQVHKEDLSPQQILEVMLEHTAAFVELYGGIKPLEMMKKHLKAYAQGFEGATQLRARLMQAADYAAMREITTQFCG